MLKRIDFLPFVSPSCRWGTVLAAGILFFVIGNSCHKQVAPQREVFICVPSTPLLLTPRSGFQPIRVLPNREHVAVLFERDDWMKARTSKGEEGWIPRADTAELSVLNLAKKMIDAAKTQQAQFKARLGADANLRMEPLKNAPFPGRLNKDSVVDVLGKSERGRSSPLALFYKVRAEDGETGWIAGWLIEPLMPEALQPYQEERKLGACIEINRMTASAGDVPQYVLADLSPDAGPDIDFDRIRVFTWNKKKSSYGTAFVERGMKGILPITKETTGDNNLLIRILQISRSGAAEETTYTYQPPYFRKVAGAGMVSEISHWRHSSLARVKPASSGHRFIFLCPLRS